jgi:hypothetical protein
MLEDAVALQTDGSQHFVRFATVRAFLHHPEDARQNFGETRRLHEGAALAIPIDMARIRSSRRGGDTRVTVTGRLAAIDMGRLEHACSRALTARDVALDIDLRGVTELDVTARAILGRMAVRGARIRYPPQLATPTEPSDVSTTPSRDSA